MEPIRFRCRGIIHEFTQPVLLVKGSIESIEPLVPPDAIRTSVQLLRYRGISYLQEMHAIDLSRIPAEAMPLLQSTAIVEAQHWESAIQTQPMGFLSQIYCIGWRQGSLQTLSQVQHRLLSLFLDYRRGYAAGLEWRCALKN